MKKILATGAVLVIFHLTGPTARADTFNISPSADSDCSDLACDFGSALTAAASNGKDDVLSLSAGVYDLSGAPSYLSYYSFLYNPDAGENHTLTVRGAGIGATILDATVPSPNFGSFLQASTQGLANDDNAGITIRDVSFRNANAGALQLSSTNAPLTLEDCEFSENHNSAGFPTSTGGATVGTDAGTITVTGVSVRNNSSDTGWNGGGAFYAKTSGQVILGGNVFVGNSAKGTAGAFEAGTDSGAVTLTNNVVYGNSANYAGGGWIYVNTGTAAITNNTWFANAATADGGGLFIDMGSPSSAADFFNNILFGNTAGGNGADLYVWDNDNPGKTPATANVSHNDYSVFFSTCLNDASCAPSAQVVLANNLDDDPLLADPANGDFHLQKTSPAIDQGIEPAPGLPSVDFEGDPRVLGSSPDLGADEAGRCGDGFAGAGEECDTGNGSPDTCGAGTACASAGTEGECTCQAVAEGTGGSGGTSSDTGTGGVSRGAGGGCNLVR